jgi:quinol monooxygenase YgiN
MFLSMIHIYPFPGDALKVMEVLDSVRHLIVTKADNKGCLLMMETDEFDSICYLERWGTREALERHLRSSLYCRVLEAMELSCTPPKVEFYEITDIGGLDLIERVRLNLMIADNIEAKGDSGHKTAVPESRMHTTPKKD